MWAGGDPLALIETLEKLEPTWECSPRRSKGTHEELKNLVGEMEDICNRVNNKNNQKNIIADLPPTPEKELSVSAEDTHRSEFRLWRTSTKKWR